MSSVADETTSDRGTPAKEKPAEPAPAKAEAKEKPQDAGKQKRPRRRVSAKEVAHGAKAGSDAVRNRIASLVSIVAVLCAVILVLGAIFVALNDVVGQNNPVVEWVKHTADGLANGLINFGDSSGGIFDFEKKNGNPNYAYNALANWGIAAVVYLVVGKIVSRVIRP